MTDLPNVKGLDETLANLRDLPQRIGRRELRLSLEAAAKPVWLAARAYVPDDPATGAPDLKSSLVISTRLTPRARRSRPKQSEVEVYIGPSRAEGRKVLNYAALVEFGTINTPAQPYLAPAWDRTKGLVMSTFARELGKRVEAAAIRVSKRFHRIR